MSTQHVAFSPSVHQFDDPDELECAQPLATKTEDPARNSNATASETWPTSPRSLMTSVGSQHELSDCSPSPSVASVRIAHLVQGTKAGYVQARKTFNSAQKIARISVATDRSAGSSSVQLASVDEDDVPLSNLAEQGSTEIEQSAPRGPSLEPLLKELSLRHALPKSTSNDSVASWRETLEAAIPELKATSGLGRPEDDVSQRRMRSILGPKVKILSKAPWDADDLDDKENDRRSVSESVDGIVQEAARASVEQKLKPNGRSKSFSILTSRKSPRAESETKARDDAFRGLRLDFDTFQSKPVKTSPDRSSKQSPTTVGDSFPDLSSLASPLAPSPGRVPQSPHSLTPSDSLERGARFKQTRPSPLPIKVDNNGDLLQPVRSAPPSVLSFTAIAPMYRSDSGASLLAQPPIGSSSSSSLSNSNYSGPSTPTTLSQVFPAALNVGPDSYFSSQSTPSPNTAPKVKLISLDEARQRESERIAAAAARRKEQMTPVEHIAVRADKSPPPAAKATKSREPSSLDSAGRSRSRTPTSTALDPSSPPLPGAQRLSSAATASASGAKTLKPKRSGFLRRMMGVDKVDGTVPPVPVLAINASTAMSSEQRMSSITTTSTSDFVVTSSPLPSPPVEAAAAHVAFSPPPPVFRERRGRMLAPAPSLSLRPISMAFSAGFDADLLANEAASAARAAQVSSPVFSTASADHFSFSECDELESVTSSSLPPTTPATPFFDQVEMTSPKLTPVHELPKSPSAVETKPVLVDYKLAYESLTVAHERATQLWRSQQGVLEQQVASLRRELDQLKADPCRCRWV
ncbi:hypothetical protein ACM66B_003803 [Microbotryomycetes sp. NB124-2]